MEIYIFNQSLVSLSHTHTHTHTHTHAHPNIYNTQLRTNLDFVLCEGLAWFWDNLYDIQNDDL